MSDTNHETTEHTLGWIAVARFTVYFLFWFAVLFACAGRLDWLRGWIYAAAMVLTVAVHLVVVRKTNPEVIAARMKWHHGTKPFDKVFLAFYTPAAFALIVVAGLDARFGSSAAPFALIWVGLGLHFLGDAPLLWAMSVNPFLEATVRIQRDRGQRVITTGPYAYVRHPMYLGAIFMFSGWPLILGSYRAFIPAGVIVVLLLIRTALEDRVLRRELEGYEGYARRTRYRILPGVW